MTARVESTCTLPGEVSGLRGLEKSAESVVVKIAAERRKERRDEESRKWCTIRACGTRREGGRKRETLQLRQPPHAALGTVASGFLRLC